MNSFLEGRPVLKSQNASAIARGPGFQPLAAAPPAAGGNGCVSQQDGLSQAEGHGAGAQIELVRREGVIVRIVVTCGCGSKTELECEY